MTFSSHRMKNFAPRNTPKREYFGGSRFGGCVSTTFPIESPNGDMTLEYQSYTLDENDIKFSEYECKQKGLTYAIPLKAQIDLVFNQTGEIRRKSIYMGDIPLMTERGTFIINGAERVVVSQIHRSPGVIFLMIKASIQAGLFPIVEAGLNLKLTRKRSDLCKAR